jgi:hypothetical protein
MFDVKLGFAVTQPTPEFDQVFNTQIHKRFWRPGNQETDAECARYRWYLAIFAVLLYLVNSCGPRA